MGLSYREWVALYPDLAHEHPDHPSNRVAVAELPAGAVLGPTRVKVPKLNAKGQNKTEALFDAELAAHMSEYRVTWYEFEPIKVRLAGNTTYRIDFLSQRADGSMAGFEVKGFMREDAAVKLKVAAERNPWLDLYLVQRHKRDWLVRRVTRAGIGRRTITLQMAIDGIEQV